MAPNGLHQNSTKNIPIMKTKFFLFALAVALAACNTNAPEKKELIGTWSEPYHVAVNVKSITFDNNDSLC